VGVHHHSARAAGPVAHGRGNDRRVAEDEKTSWYGIRCLFRLGPADAEATSYEERVTIWLAASFDEAIAAAEADAEAYAAADEGSGNEYLGLLQAYALPEQPGHGAEVFSLIRESALPADAYLDRFFDTGDERQQSVE
jgi:hypothetical protein